MTERSKFANEPLMYIHQPSVGKPSAPMQHFYSSPKKTATQATTTTQPPEAEKKTIKKSPSLNALTKDIAKELKEPVPMKKTTKLAPVADEAESPPTPNKPSVQGNERKKFKDMSILEKVDYFIGTPKHLPSMRCEVITNERKYRGVIRDFEESNVLMQVGRRSSLTQIKLEDITEIQLLGF